MTPDPSTPLLVIDTPAAMRHWSAGQHAAGASVALVPTMGALHDGHLELLRVAHQHADVRFFMATSTPDAIRAENAQAQLRWLTLPAARDTTSEPNLREALTRIEPLLKPRTT